MLEMRLRDMERPEGFDEQKEMLTVRSDTIFHPDKTYCIGPDAIGG